MPEAASRIWIQRSREIMVTLAGLLIILLTLAFGRVDSTLVLITATNYSLPFADTEVSFAPRVPRVGIMGIVFAADPLNACEPLQNAKQTEIPAFLLVERGACDFVMKVEHVQDAGYDAAIVYNNVDGQDLVTMSGTVTNIDIYAVFISKRAGEALQRFTGDMDSRCYLFPAFENTTRSVMAISFISLLTVFAVLSTLFFVRRHRLRLTGSGLVQEESGGMTFKEVKALPIILFDSGVRATIETCAICLEEYTSGEKLRVLPCSHEFHVACIDQWLTTRRPFCPICKQDAHAKRINEPPSEHTPLLASFESQLGSTLPSVPVSAQNSQIRSSPESPADFANPFVRTPHEIQHTLSCPVSQFYGEDEGATLSCSEFTNATAASSTLTVAHNIDGLCACQTHPSANNSAVNVEEEVVIEVTSTE